MEISEYKNIFENEESHFLYKANHKIIFSLINTYLKSSILSKNFKILDAGCGTGLLAKKLEVFGNVVSIDISNEAIKFAKMRRIKAKKASITSLPFDNNTFDLITCVDVLNHTWVKNDLTALKEFKRVLKPNGILIIRVSANNWLNLKHDRFVWINKRYSKKELLKLLKSSRFKIEKISYINMFLLPLAIAKSVIEKYSADKYIVSVVSKTPKLINEILYSILSSEAFLLTNFDLPFGLGLIAVAKKTT